MPETGRNPHTHTHTQIYIYIYTCNHLHIGSSVYMYRLVSVLQETLAGQARKASFKLEKNIKPFVHLTPMFICELFDKLVLPILNYEIWGFLSAKAIDTVHLQFFKRLSTQNDFVYMANLVECFYDMSKTSCIMQSHHQLRLRHTITFWSTFYERSKIV